MRLSKMSKILK